MCVCRDWLNLWLTLSWLATELRLGLAGQIGRRFGEALVRGDSCGWSEFDLTSKTLYLLDGPTTGEAHNQLGSLRIDLNLIGHLWGVLSGRMR